MIPLTNVGRAKDLSNLQYEILTLETRYEELIVPKGSLSKIERLIFSTNIFDARLLCEGNIDLYNTFLNYFNEKTTVNCDIVKVVYALYLSYSVDMKQEERDKIHKVASELKKESINNYE